MEPIVMADSRPADLLYQLRRAFRHDRDREATDGQLLERFLNHRSEAAFETLVRRHGSMVLGVCRRVLRHSQDAEDAFQATFLILVRKAAGLRGRRTVGDWLYGVAHNTALKARAANQRRRVKERQISIHRSQPPEAPEPNDWLPLLDQELSGLPDRYRRAIVLCDLEGKSRREAARLLGRREGTLSGRLARGRVLLARRLARRGVALSGGTLAAALATQATAALPPPLLIHTVQAAIRVGAGPLAAAAAPSVPVASLTEGVLRAMFLSKIKVATVVVLSLGLAGAGLGVLCRGVDADTPGGVEKKSAKSGAVLVQIPTRPRSNREIEEQLQSTVNLRFENTPLRQVLLDMGESFRLNIVVDRPALAQAAIAEERPISIKLEGVTLKSALGFILHDAGLGYEIKEGVLFVTTDPQKILTKVYPVAELILPVDRKKDKKGKPADKKVNGQGKGTN
jgi:RNA polymerase sigma factor (sigma-70 family)